jgi:hypothetical protein
MFSQILIHVPLPVHEIEFQQLSNNRRGYMRRCGHCEHCMYNGLPIIAASMEWTHHRDL